MKKILLLIFFVSVITGFSSCVDFLNQTPDAQNYKEADVFTNYAKSQSFIDQLLVPYAYFDDNDYAGSHAGDVVFYGKSMYGLRERITDNCLTTKFTWVNALRWRNGQNPTNDATYFCDGCPAQFSTYWKAIRIANLSIANVDRIIDVTPEQKANILGEAYFLRGFFYFQLLQG